MQDIPTKPNSTIVSAFGYFLVSCICLFAGINFKGSPLKFELTKFLFLFPLYGFYLFWVIVYDTRLRIEEKKEIKYGNYQGLYWVTIVIFLFLTYFFQKENKLNATLIFIAGQLPFFLLSRFLMKAATNDFKNITFRTFIFFPAVITCIVPFLVGFVDPINPFYFFGFTILLVVYYNAIRSSYFYKKIIFYSFVIYLLIYIGTLGRYDVIRLFGYVILNKVGLDFFRACAVSMTLAIILGLTESWWFLKDPKNYNFSAEGVSLPFYTKWVDRSTRFFPFLVPILILHKSFNTFTFFLIFLAAYIYLFYENKFNSEENINWQKSRVFLGFGITIFFVLSTITFDPLNIKYVFFLTSFNFVAITFIAIALGVLAIIQNSTIKDHIVRIFDPQKLITILICITLFILSLSIEYFTTSNKINLSNSSFHQFPIEFSNDDSLSEKNESIDNYFTLYQYDTLKNKYIRQNSMILGFTEKNNFELYNRAGICKLIYGILFIWLILMAPIKLLFKQLVNQTE